MPVLEDIKILEKYLKSDGVDYFAEQAIKKLISHTLQREQKDLDEITDELRSYENKYDMNSDEFHKRFHQGELNDSEDFFVWDAALEMRNRIAARIAILMGRSKSDAKSSN